MSLENSLEGLFSHDLTDIILSELLKERDVLKLLKKALQGASPVCTAHGS